MSCDHYPPFGVCTGHGICSGNDSSCKCDDGWSSIGDFSTKDGDHCGIHVNAIRALWIIAFIPFLYLFYLCAKLTKMRRDNIKQQQSSQPSNQNTLNNRKSKQLSWNEPVAIFPILFLLTSAFALMLTVLRIVDPVKYSIAHDPFATALLYLFCLSAISGGCVYLLLLINFMDGYAKIMSASAGQNIKNQSNVMRYVAVGIVMFLPVACSPPFYNITNPGHDRESMVSFSIAVILLFAILGFSLVRYLFIISREIKLYLDFNDKNNIQSENNNSNNTEKFKKAKDKIEKAWMLVLFVSVVSIIQYSIFIFVPFISKMSSYIFPILILGVGVVGIMFDFSVMQESKNSKIDKASSDSHKNIHVGVVTPVLPTGNTYDIHKTVSPSSAVEAIE